MDKDPAAMEQKIRPSLDSVSSKSSALRRLTRSPGHRLGLPLRRSSAESSRSSVSLASEASEAPQSACVSRDTARYECALHRFIVWSACKRNACDKMTPEEKRECPLLRCRKRFENHELMLQHLYECNQLALGEYWCYDCEKVEHFSDARCKRCLGHPSKRRRIISMARNLFSSLGHKSKATTSLIDLDMDVDEAPPPSYASILEPPQAELHSNEIHEIDSFEVPLPTIIEDEDEPESMPPPAPKPSYAGSRRPVELESTPVLTHSFVAWGQSPTTIDPTSLIENAHVRSPERPVLQVHTAGLEQYRAHVKRRSRMLAPSSSVRSTASTASTNSTNSLSSTASYNISPMSAWSGTWARAPGFDSTLTSPADDLASPGGLLPTNPFATSCKAVMDHDVVLDKESSDPFLSELPADESMLDVFPSSDPVHDTFKLDQTLLPTHPPLSPEPSLQPDILKMDKSTDPFSMSQLNTGPTVGSYFGPQALVDTVWEAMKAHISESMAKLQLTKQHLASQLRSMSPTAVALDGLELLIEILDGNRPADPRKLLCFVHLVYSFSLVVHEQDAPKHWKDLFCQAMSYSAWLSREDRQAYIRVVDALWKPANITQEEVVDMLRAKVASSGPSFTSTKGKEPEAAIQGGNHDPLLFVAQHFLDELEYSAIQVSDQPEIQASEISMQHIHDCNLDTQPDSPFAIAVSFIFRLLSQQYASVPEFSTILDELLKRVDTNFISTTRRLELELVHAGRIFLPSSIYFDDYIPQIRAQIDSLYSQPGLETSSRLTYYRHSVKLIEAILKRNDDNQDPSNQHMFSGTALDSIDEVIEAMTPGVNDFDFSAVMNFDTEGALGYSAPMSDMAMNPYNLGERSQLLVTPEATSSNAGPSTAVTSPPSPTPVGSSGKVESDSCCNICGYRPKGDPRWFGGSMAKHKKLQHATSPPKIYRCPFPGCTSQYKNRPDNLRQHQIDKGHFMDGQGENVRRPSKRKKTEQQ